MNINLADTKYKEIEENNENDYPGNKPGGLLRSLLIFVLVMSLGWGGFLLFQRIKLVNENERFETSIKTTTQEIRRLTNSKNPAKKIMIGKILKKAKGNRVIWSRIMAQVIKLETTSVIFNDFSVTPEGKVRALLSAKNFEDIKQFEAYLNSNKDVENVIINTISTGKVLISDKLEVEINFNLNIKDEE